MVEPFKSFESKISMKEKKKKDFPKVQDGCRLATDLEEEIMQYFN